MSFRPKVILREKRESSVRRFHPWIFSGAVAEVRGEAPPGALVDVYSSSGRFVACGHYGAEGIAVRIVSFAEVPDESQLVRSRLEAALDLRAALQLETSGQTTAYRVFNAEGDGLSGLIIDRYAETLVVQCHSPGVLRLREMIVDYLRASYRERAETILDRSPQNAEEDAPRCTVLYGEPRAVLIKENGLTFRVDCEAGQKTGFFLDQRENRALLERYCSGRRVLNAFAYTGGFSAYALRGGARYVRSIDISQRSLEQLEENIRLNFSQADAEAQAADCLEFLKKLEDRYDLIVLDPPAFVKHRGALKGGIKGYESINLNALRTIASGGILFTFSCSQFVDRALFRATVTSAAERAGRNVRILHEMRQAPCHPASLFHPEGEYLKGLVLLVSDR